MKNAMQLKGIIKNMAAKTGIKANALLQNYMLERLIERIFVSSNASDFLDTLYKPINDKAESLVKRQWFESKKAKSELQSIDAKKADLQGYIGLMSEDDSDEKRYIVSQKIVRFCTFLLTTDQSSECLYR